VSQSQKRVYKQLEFGKHKLPKLALNQEKAINFLNFKFIVLQKALEFKLYA
jgi:hypothetical protein